MFPSFGVDAGFLALLKVWNELLNIIVSIFYPEFLTLLKVWSGFLMCFILNVWSWCEGERVCWCGGRESVLFIGTQFSNLYMLGWCGGISDKCSLT